MTTPRTTRTLLLLLGLLAALAQIPFFEATFAKDPRDIASEVLPSVVLVVMGDANAKPVSQGSGFVVRRGVVATNFHVIENAAVGFVKPPASDTPYEVTGVLAISTDLDLALLAVPNLKVKPLPLADPSLVKVGDKVFAAGSPGGLEATFSDGIVSGIRSAKGEHFFQITAPISAGSSGGPVVNEEGAVIGVATLTSKTGQNLNFAVSSAHLNQLLALEGTTEPLAKATKGHPPVANTAVEDNQVQEQDTLKLEIRNIVFPKACWVPTISFSVVNRYDRPVRFIEFEAIFYDQDGVPLDVEDLIQAVAWRGAKLEPGLATRVDVHSALISEDVCLLSGLASPNPRLKLRVTNFLFAD